MIVLKRKNFFRCFGILAVNYVRSLSQEAAEFEDVGRRVDLPLGAAFVLLERRGVLFPSSRHGIFQQLLPLVLGGGGEMAAHMHSFLWYQSHRANPDPSPRDQTQQPQAGSSKTLFLTI